MKQAKKDDRIFVITPDLGYSVFDTFAEEFPDKFLNVGIAEQNAIGIASGLALSGRLVYVYSIIPFMTMRCYEQIRVDVAYMNTNVRIVGVGAGLSYGSAGATHHAIEDIAIMRVLPNMTVCCPGDPLEVEWVMNKSVMYNGPMYIRLGKSGESNIHQQKIGCEFGKAIPLLKGDTLAILTTSNMLEIGFELSKRLREVGLSIELASMPVVKPLDVEYIMQLVERDLSIVTLEEHSIIGGFGSAVAEVIAELNCKVKFKRIAIKDCYSHCVGGHRVLREHFGLCTDKIFCELIGFLADK
ncbi:transketolase family protein [Clostridium thermosuccinogenes]|nr:transketolase C-terminal domain-containing protein [Pseudoclostridium thermosuccinogenes]